MKFLKLQVENFMAIASAEVELDQRGLVLIQGVNSGDTSAASNGAGKSTLMNSLMWCLYGETAHGVKGDDVLSTGHEKNCRVMVTVEDEGKKYAIIRHRKHKEFKNRLIVRGEDGEPAIAKQCLMRMQALSLPVMNSSFPPAACCVVLLAPVLKWCLSVVVRKRSKAQPSAG